MLKRGKREETMMSPSYQRVAAMTVAAAACSGPMSKMAGSSDLRQTMVRSPRYVHVCEVAPTDRGFIIRTG